MAQILITHLTETHLYSPIASIKQYNEPDFEDKLWRYSSKIFEHYFVFKFKFDLYCDELPDPYKPDLLLVSKTFKKWVLLEVELCKTPSQHTLNQIKCFSKPKYKPTEITDFLIRNNRGYDYGQHRDDLINCFSDNSPELIVVMDDYSEKVFQKYYDNFPQLKICVLEVYKRAEYPFEGFRFGGDYPYELTNSSKIEYSDDRHYKILKRDFAKDLPKDFEVKFLMSTFHATVIKAGRSNFYLKLPEHNIPNDLYLQIGINLNGEYIIQKF